MRAPTVAAGDGALGFWAALRDVFPETVEARCWVHKAANVLNALPKSAQPAARKAIAEIRDAEDRDHALKAIKAFEADYGAKWPKAVVVVAAVEAGRLEAVSAPDGWKVSEGAIDAYVAASRIEPGSRRRWPARDQDRASYIGRRRRLR